MKEDDDDGSDDLGELIRLIRWARGWSQAKLARRTGIDRGQINRYESGKDTPRPATFHQILSEAGIPLRLVGFLRWCLRLIRKALVIGPGVEEPPREGPGPRIETRNAVWSAVDRTLSMARTELALLRDTPAPNLPSPPTEQDILQADALLERLRSYPEPKQRLLVEGARAYRQWLLCLRACAASERTAADHPDEALKLAELAAFVARHVPGTEAWRSRLQGLCTGFVANAHRVGKDLRLAEATFARAWRLWREGEDEAGLLSEAQLLDLEASLRRDQKLGTARKNTGLQFEG